MKTPATPADDGDDTRIIDAENSGRLRQVRELIRNAALGYDRLPLRLRVDALNKAAFGCVRVLVPSLGENEAVLEVDAIAAIGLHSPQSLSPAQIKRMAEALTLPHRRKIGNPEMKMSPATIDLLGTIAPGMADRLRSGLVVDFDEELVERLVRAAREAGPLEPTAAAGYSVGPGAPRR